MATTTKDIELILRAKLEAGDTATQAKAIGDNIATELAKAFDGLGEKIAQRLFTAIEAGQSALIQKVQQGQIDFDRNNAPGSTPSENLKRLRSSAGVEMDVERSAERMVTQLHPTGGSTISQPSGGLGSTSSSPYFRQTKFAQDSADFQNFMSGNENPQLKEYARQGYKDFNVEKALEVDSASTRLQMAMQMKKLDPSFQMGDDLQKDAQKVQGYLTTSAKAGMSEFEALNKQLEALTKELHDHRDTLEEQIKDNKIKEGDKDYRKVADEKGTIEDRITTIMRKFNDDASMAGKMKAAGLGPQEEGPGMGAMIAGGAIKAGAALRFAGQVPGDIRAFESNLSEVQNKGTRSLMRGNFDDMLSMQMLGGEGAVRNEGLLEGGMTTVGNMLTGGAKYAGVGAAVGGAASFMGLGIGAVPGAIVGGAYGLYDGFKNGPANVNRSMDDQLKQNQLKNAEFFTEYGMGRNQANRGYRTAQAIGSPEYADFLMGGGNVEGPNATGLDRMLSVDADLPAPSSIPVPFDAKRKSMRRFATDIGLSNAQYDQSLGGLAQGIGGNFMNGQTLLQPGMGNGIKDMLQAQAMGLNDAAGIGSGLYQGGMDPEEALKKTKELYIEIFASGLDKAQAGRAMVQMSQQAASGLGAAAGAQTDMLRATAGAQSMAGVGNNITDSQFNFSRKVLDFDKSQSKSMGGTGMVQGFMGAQDTISKAKSAGVDFGNADEMNLELFFKQYGDTMTPKALEEFLSKHGGKASSGAIKSTVGLAQGQSTRGAEMFRGSLPGGAGEAFDTLNGPAITAEERMALEGTRAGQNGRPVEQMGPFQQGPQTTAGKIAQAQEQKDAATITDGVNSLGLVLDDLKGALKSLVDRADQVLAEQSFNLLLNPKTSVAQPGSGSR